MQPNPVGFIKLERVVKLWACDVIGTHLFALALVLTSLTNGANLENI